MDLPKDMLEVYDMYSTLTVTYVHLLVLISMCSVHSYRSFKKVDMLQF